MEQTKITMPIGDTPMNNDDWDDNEPDADDGWSDNDDDGPGQIDEKMNEQEMNEIDQKGYVILKESEVDARIRKIIQMVNDTLCLNNEDEILVILRHYKWNKEKIESEWFAED
jgi:hypothetical protein